ncbi:MAG: peptidylprolyl isomerase [Bacteroidetes bacterium]|nr:peptidylprolyl isomerase [Bacteroidota bacterium]
MKKLIVLFLACISISVGAVKAQVLDEIVAVVADRIILRSDIELAYEQFSKQTGITHDSIRCEIVKQKLIENLMIVKAQVDSLPVNEDRIDAEIEDRIRYFAKQYGGEKALEEISGKSIQELKATQRESIKNSQLIQEMQRKIVKDIKVSPTDIKNYFNSLPKDSLPYYSAEIELAQLIIEPKISKESRQAAFEKISDLRKRIVEGGERFSTLALIYSDDKVSAANGGELGYFGRGTMVPEFEAAAFKLKPDSVSKIIETTYGFHIIQAIQRRGEEMNARHILIMPKIYSSDMEKAKNRMDSIVQLIKMDSISFEKAVQKFSDDNETKGNGGFIGSGGLGNTRVPVDELDKNVYLSVSNLEPGEISEPELMVLPGPDQKKAWRVYYLKSEMPPHVANLKDDYQKFNGLAFNKKQSDAMQKWIEKNRKEFYIQVNGPYAKCASIKDWIQPRK